MAGYSHLLAPGRLGSLERRNRIVMGPMGDDLCHEDGTISEHQLAYAKARANGGDSNTTLTTLTTLTPLDPSADLLAFGQRQRFCWHAGTPPVRGCV